MLRIKTSYAAPAVIVDVLVLILPRLKHCPRKLYRRWQRSPNSTEQGHREQPILRIVRIHWAPYTKYREKIVAPIGRGDSKTLVQRISA